MSRHSPPPSTDGLKFANECLAVIEDPRSSAKKARVERVVAESFIADDSGFEGGAARSSFRVEDAPRCVVPETQPSLVAPECVVLGTQPSQHGTAHPPLMSQASSQHSRGASTGSVALCTTTTPAEISW